MLEKNKVSFSVVRSVKENIINDRAPVHNPIALVGLDKLIRYRIFWAIFNKEFNREHRGTYMYRSCDNVDLDLVKDKKLIIVENVELLSGKEALQKEVEELFTMCFEHKIQIIFCSNIDIKELEIDEHLKSKMLSGLILYLNR